MPKYWFSLIRIFSYKDKIADSVPMRRNTAQRKPLPGIFYAVKYERNEFVDAIRSFLLVTVVNNSKNSMLDKHFKKMLSRELHNLINLITLKPFSYYMKNDTSNKHVNSIIIYISYQGCLFMF